MNSSSDSDQGRMAAVSEALIVARAALGAANIVVAAGLVAWLFARRRLGSFFSRLVLYLLLSQIIDQLAWAFGSPPDGTAACLAQALLQSYGDWAVILWSACIATLGYAIVVWQLAGTRSQEVVYALVSFGLPLVFAALPLFVDAYGASGGWCWVRGDKPLWQLGVLYFPLAFVVAVVTFCWIRSEIGIRKMAKREASGSFYRRSKRRLTAAIAVVIRRSRFLLAVFVFAWSIPLFVRVIQAMASEESLRAKIAYSVLSTACVPLWSLLCVLAFWVSEGAHSDSSAGSTGRYSNTVSTTLQYSEHASFHEDVAATASGTAMPTVAAILEQPLLLSTTDEDAAN